MKIHSVKKPKRKKDNSSSSGRSLLLRIFLMLFLCAGSVYGSYAQNTRTVTGKVSEANGDPVIGASVSIAGTNNGTVTDATGNFTLEAPDKSVLVVSYLGFKTQRITVGGGKSPDIILEEDTQYLNEVVVVAYGTQKKVNLTGAVSAINSEELVVTKNQNIQNMMTGKIPGVRVIQKTSEPGEFNNQFDIRGFGSPLLVVDGIPRGDIQRIDPNEVESISVLKDASAAVYGVRGGNGVILVTTKKGERGKMKVEYSMYYGFQKPSEILKPVDAIGRYTLANEKQMRNLTNPSWKWSQNQIDQFLNGERQSTDWYDAVLRNSAPQQSHNISFSGGSDKVNYFVNLGYLDQTGFFREDALNYDRYNVRSNLDIQATKELLFSVKLNGWVENRMGNSQDSWTIFKNLWRSAPDDPVFANNTSPYLQRPQSSDDNPVALINNDLTGYHQRGAKLLQTSFEGEYTVPKINGLKLKGLLSYDNKITDESLWNKEYFFYTYNEAANSFSPYSRLSPTYLKRSYGNNWSTLWNISANYDNTFAGNHIAALLLFEESHSVGDNFFSQRNFSIPLPYLFAGNSDQQQGSANANGMPETSTGALVGRLNYDYKSRYLIEFSFRNDGSSKFPSNKHYQFFPGVSAGWRISEESFIKEHLTFFDNLKLRGSYGEMGDDAALAYQFLTGYDYPNTSGGSYNNYPTGYIFGGAYTNSLGFRAVANPDITWTTIKTANIGLDADLWKGKFGLTFEIFQRNQTGLLADRLVSLPGTFGSKMPQENINSDRTKGIELELRHRNTIGDFHYDVTGQISLTRGMNLYFEQAPAGNSYTNWRNGKSDRYNDLWWGWGAAGRYTGYDQIANSIYSNSGTLPGDYIYEDWNGDGVIDDMDKHPIATTTNPSDNFQDRRNYPLMNFGLSLNGSWKGLDMNLMFQGSAMSYIGYGEQLTSPLMWDGNALDIFLDRWRPEDPHQHPYDPSAQWIPGYFSYGATTPDANSRFMIQKGDYLRLKSAEIGYTLPKRWLSCVRVQSLRVYFNAYNLLTFTGVTGGMDPEKPSELYGYMYPLNKTFNFGANLTF